MLVRETISIFEVEGHFFFFAEPPTAKKRHAACSTESALREAPFFSLSMANQCSVCLGTVFSQDEGLIVCLTCGTQSQVRARRKPEQAL